MWSNHNPLCVCSLNNASGCPAWWLNVPYTTNSVSKGGLRLYSAQTWYQSSSNTEACLQCKYTERETDVWMAYRTAFLFDIISVWFRFCLVSFFLSFFLSVSPLPPKHISCPLYDLWSWASIENELHFHLAWQIERSVKASKCHLYLVGTINKVAIDPSLFIHNSSRVCAGDINHAGQDLCGHRRSLPTAAWDTNRLSGCWISAFESLTWPNTPVRLCVN